MIIIGLITIVICFIFIIEATTALVNLLISLGCTDPHPLTGNANGNSSNNSTGTLSRRRETTSFEKIPSSVV